VEGILRQSADVEDVERRVHEYEQGLCLYLCFLIWFHDKGFHRSLSAYGNRLTMVFCTCSGRNLFSPDEDAHVIGDCIKVKSYAAF
jgi:hypothetical protein